MTRKNEILSRVMALAAIMEAEQYGREAGEWNRLLSERWCRVSIWTTRRDLDALTAIGVVRVVAASGAKLYQWDQWPMPLT